ncbi:uncharacterized protein LOC110441787 [Mizuhopecten yessoensis]|uniref:Uncharacterized protein n=1 Tax=Mizuhopecten yessoensis TaxID=6573 RepID=A0A210PIN4_MIZYE|nr:uncharacterized protein LOC110441787 [Mizuhopecten yessoensis]XP_021340714.1 uncharacterized protein LOC110441787 [Mizuhopecten yessoensis]OWF36342.1 hypothetical protein KP79_PYT09329 [Mizuhopecten yessoensis]
MENSAYNVTLSNVTSVSQNSTEGPYDAEGAMKFTVAVVTMYSIGMVGVLVMGLRNSRKTNSDVDEEVDYFMKDINKVRIRLEKKGRLESINKLLDSMNIDTRVKNVSVVGSGLLPFMALPVFMSDCSRQPEVKKPHQKIDSDLDTDDGASSSDLENSMNNAQGWYRRQESCLTENTILELDENDNKETEEEDSLLKSNCIELKELHINC